MIYVVTGYPRSGTSMMMAALKAGGLGIAWDESRERLNWMDTSSQPNKLGLFEIEPTKMWSPGWPREHNGKALKCFTRHLRHLAVHEYRIALIRRDPEEVRQSFQGWFNERVTTQQVEREIEEGLATLLNRRDVRDVKLLDYEQVVRFPLESFRDLHWPIDAAAAARIPTESEYHFRKSQLVVGL